jgi:hypothetical protein
MIGPVFDDIFKRLYRYDTETIYESRTTQNAICLSGMWLPGYSLERPLSGMRPMEFVARGS